MSTIIAVVGQKGGPGKSTFSQCLAVAAHLDGKAVAILDMDDQCSVMKWKARRGDDDPAVLQVTPAELDSKLQQLGEIADLVIIDTPGRLDSVVHRVIQRSDLVIVVTPPTAKEIETVENTFDLIMKADNVRRPMFVVLNKVRPNAKSKPGDAREFIRQLERDFALKLPVCDDMLHSYAVYDDADLLGRAPQELEPNSQPARDIRGVYKRTIKVVNKFTSNQTGSKHGEETVTDTAA